MRAIVIAGLVACGGSAPVSAPVSNVARPTTTAPAPAPTTGTSGFGTLSWRATGTTILAAYPDATPTEDGYRFTGPVEGLLATTTFTLSDGGLELIQVIFDVELTSMEACEPIWRRRRAVLDDRLGASTAKVLAAFWRTPTTEVVMACSPYGRGVVFSTVYSPPSPDEE